MSDKGTMFMIQEKIKTGILIALVISSLFFTKQIWFGDKLWSSDYNFFANWRKTSTEQMIPNKEDLVNPLHFVVNRGEFQLVYGDHQPAYRQLNDLLQDVYSTLFSEPQVAHEEVSVVQWYDILNGRAPYYYIDFGIVSSVKALGQIFGISDTDVSSYVSSFQQSMIVPGDALSRNISIYIKDNHNQNIHKFQLPYSKTQFKALNEQSRKSFEIRHAFSFQLGFDTPKENSKITIAPEILIPVDRQQVYAIQGDNALDVEKNETREHILRAFQYTPNTLRQYVDTDNTVVYTENHSTLKISPDGLIEYRALESGRGMRLTDTHRDIAPTEYDSLNMAIELMQQVGKINPHLHLTSDIVEDPNRPGVHRFTFDYYYNGYPILMQLENTTLRNAIEIEIVNGTLRYYRQYVRDYSLKQLVNVNVPMLHAVEDYYNRANIYPEQMHIMQLGIGYVDKGSDMMKLPHWYLKLTDEDVYHTIPAVR